MSKSYRALCAALAIVSSLVLGACAVSGPANPAVPAAVSPGSVRSAAPALNLSSYALLAGLNVIPTGAKGPVLRRALRPDGNTKGGSTGPFATEVYDFTFISDPYPGECQESHPFTPVIDATTPGTLITESQSLPDICLDTESARRLAHGTAPQAFYIVAVDKDVNAKGPPAVTPVLGPATLAYGTLTFPAPNNPYYPIDASGNKYGFYLALDLDTKDPLPQP